MSNHSSKRRPPTRQPLLQLSKGEIEKRLLNSSRNNCINWRGSAIRSGDNVLLEIDGKTAPRIGQLIDLRDENLIPHGEIKFTRGYKEPRRMALVSWFSLVDEKEARRSPVGDRCHLPYRMEEVCQTSTAEWVSCCGVVNICFIFHLEAIQKGYVSCGGIKRVYFLRFHKINGNLVPLKERYYKPFYRDPKFHFQEGFPKSIWSQLSSLKHQLTKEMSCGGVWDGRTKSVNLNGVPPSFFGYLKQQLETESTRTLQYNKIRTSRPRKHIYDNFAAQQVRISTLVHQIRVLEES
jgi:hypothetical protein